MTSIYLQRVLEQIPQILSNEDRDPLSPSYGSFDRKYWGWKYKDFSDATLQCALSPLIQIWDWEAPENPYYRHEALFAWIAAGVDFLFRIRHADGGFDQCYPYERAPGNTYELFESVALFLEKAGERISPERAAHYRRLLLESCEFTLSHDEDHGNITNHFALYAYVSHKMARFFGDARFEAKGQALLRKVLSLQSAEGWFLEYDGADAGYESRTFYYLAKLATEFSREDLFPVLENSLKNFLVYCVHPDGSLGGEYGARNTTLCFPAGFELAASRFPEAAAIAARIRAGLQADTVLSLKSLDPDNLVRLAANYLEAERAMPATASYGFRLPYENNDMERSMPLAGLHVKATEAYYFVMNACKGGVFRLYDKRTGRLVFNDTSYGAITQGGEAITANLLIPGPGPSWKNGVIDVDARFHGVLQQNVTPLKMIALRIAALTFLRVGFVARLFSRFVARVLFTGRTGLPYALHRRFVLSADAVMVTDVIENVAGLKEIEATSFSTSIHMASSKYHGAGDLPQLSRPMSRFPLGPDHHEFALETTIGFDQGRWSMMQRSEKNPGDRA